MKVLWVVNILFPEAQRVVTGNGSLKSSGGWMLGAAEALLNHEEVDLYVSCPTTLVNELCCIEGEKIKYYLFPLGEGNTRKNPEYQKYWKQISEQIEPDVVHIHGTEYSHGLEYVEACGASNVVVSIQGLTSVYTRYYKGGLDTWDVLRNITLRDILKGTLFHDQRSFNKRGKYEVELFKKVSHVIGRTSWDKAHVWAINPDSHYHFCNEILRPDFYSGSWEYQKCKKHTIFLSSAAYPIKGVHQVLKALPLILRHYPDTQVRIASGKSIYPRSFKERLLDKGYNKYLRSLIRRFHLEKHIVLLDPLDAEGMKREYLSSNVFVCPSSIENSPNSLGEAQILGVPVLASYVGGIPDMMRDDEEYIYRFEEVEMLAEKICHIFGSSLEFCNKDMRDEARERHDRFRNSNSLVQIYKDVLK